MPQADPHIVSEDGKRSFACFPAAVVVLVVNFREELLVGFHQSRQRWEAVSGALEAGETVLDGALRELREEMGPGIKVRPLGVIHAGSFHYDSCTRFMISITYLMAHEGGDIVPGDDMHGGGHRWISLKALESERETIGLPGEPWLFARAGQVFRAWTADDVVLQRPLSGENG
jgi:ADP-ribose pyrophosphatase YjhB (NUDIX family)